MPSSAKAMVENKKAKTSIIEKQRFIVGWFLHEEYEELEQTRGKQQGTFQYTPLFVREAKRHSRM
jgi:hypothetical protein